MNLFFVLFSLFMLLTPALFTLLFPPREGVELDRERIRGLRRRLWGWTAGSVFLFAFLFLGRDSALAAWWTGLPWIVGFKTQPHRLMWLAFFPLWFALGVPLLTACRPEAVGTYPGRRRAASLVPRHALPVVPGIAWLLLLLPWGGAAVFCGVHLPIEKFGVVRVFLFLLGAAFPIAIGFYAAKRVLVEPETLDPAGSEELRRAYISLRGLRTWGLFCFSGVMMLLFSTLAVLTTFGFEHAVALSGSIGGTLVGIGGTTVGVLAGIRRMRIQRQLEELSGQASGTRQPLR